MAAVVRSAGRLAALGRVALRVAICVGFAAGAAAGEESPFAPPIDLRPVALYGADVRSLVFDPASPDRVLAGSSAGHVYRSDDGGQSFRNAGVEVPFPGRVVGTLLFDPDRPTRLWAGLWGIWGGGAVALSEDLGATWEERSLGSFAGDQLYALARVPGSPGRLYAGTRDGVLVSDDLGRSWRPSGRDVPGLVHVASLHVDRERPERVIAGTWRRAFRSDDGGASWRGVFDGMVLDTEVFSLHPVPDRPGELWASTCGWVYRAEALGDRWSRKKRGLAENRTPSFAVLSADRLLAGTVAGAYLSTDGGESFRRTSRADLAVLAIAHHPARPERVLLGTEGSGIWLSNDGGESFVARPVGLRNVRIPALVAAGDQVFAALAHAGPSSGVYRSPDGGVSFEPQPAELPTVLDLAAAAGRLFAATERGLFERRSATWQRVAAAGERRVEELGLSESRLVARGPGLLLAGRRQGEEIHWNRIAADLAPRAAAFAGDTLHLLVDDLLLRLDANDQPVAAPLPYPGGRLTEAAGELYYFGDDGAYRRDRGDGAWKLLRAGRARSLATGDGRFSALLVDRDQVALYDRELGRSRALAAPFPARETLSALVLGNRLLVGTSGYGLWEGQLPE